MYQTVTIPSNSVRTHSPNIFKKKKKKGEHKSWGAVTIGGYVGCETKATEVLTSKCTKYFEFLLRTFQATRTQGTLT